MGNAIASFIAKSIMVVVFVGLFYLCIGGMSFVIEAVFYKSQNYIHKTNTQEQFIKNNADAKCYSGGKIVLQLSNVKPTLNTYSEEYVFYDQKTKTLITTSADCVIITKGKSGQNG